MSSQSSRRTFLAGAAGAVGVTAAGTVGAAAPAHAADRGHPPVGPVRITPDDPRYADLVLRRSNERFAPEPGEFCVASTTEQVVAAVRRAVRSGRRLTVRSGGHCYENFVGEPRPDVVLDLTEMDGVYFDRRRKAFAVEAGATLGRVFQTLYLGWGVTVPAGQCPTVGAGGHFQGGGYGPLSRLLGSVVDYIDAVEVVVVDRSGRARAVVATSHPDDPRHDLWWAHTGGGGGNFGVVTRYWLRDRDSKGDDPGGALPRPPANMRRGFKTWSWRELDRDTYRRLLRNHGEWHERNSGPDSPYVSLASVLQVHGVPEPAEDDEQPPRSSGNEQGDIVLFAQLDGTRPDAGELLERYFGAVSEGVGGGFQLVEPVAVPWLTAMREGGSEAPERGRQKNKAAYLRRRYTDEQIDATYEHLAEPGSTDGVLMLWLASYGGRVNTVAPDATALPQRDSIMTVIFASTWENREGKDTVDDDNVERMRRFYRAVYEGTGGVPVPNGVNDGSYINYPDVDLADPAWNTSGVPWHTLYYKDNYPRLQLVKARWDPRGVFDHALSVRPPR